MMNFADSASRRDLGLALIRAMVAVVFVFHGSQKLFGWFGGYGLEATGQWMESIGIPFGFVSALAAGLTEFAGGLLLLAGVRVAWVAVPLTATMLVAAFSAHSGFDIQAGGMEYALTLAIVAAALGLTGAGRFSWDGVKSGAHLSEGQQQAAHG